MNEYRGTINLNLAYRAPGEEGQLSYTNIAAHLAYVPERGVWSVLIDESVNVMARPGLIRGEVILPDGRWVAGDLHRMSALGNAFDLMPDPIGSSS